MNMLLSRLTLALLPLALAGCAAPTQGYQADPTKPLSAIQFVLGDTTASRMNVFFFGAADTCTDRHTITAQTYLIPENKTQWETGKRFVFHYAMQKPGSEYCVALREFTPDGRDYTIHLTSDEQGCASRVTAKDANGVVQVVETMDRPIRVPVVPSGSWCAAKN